MSVCLLTSPVKGGRGTVNLSFEALALFFCGVYAYFRYCEAIPAVQVLPVFPIHGLQSALVHPCFFSRMPTKSLRLFTTL